MTKRFIYHPTPLEDEGLNGFLLRVAEGNGLQGIRTAFSGEDNLRACIEMRLGWEAGASIADHLLRELEPARYETYKAWNHKGSRFCPECLGEKGYWRQEWELALQTACPVHQCALVDVCHQCGRDLDWKRSSLLHCECGAALIETPHSEVCDDEIRFAVLLGQRLWGQDGGPKHLQFLDLTQLHRLALFLGVYSAPVPDRRIHLKVPSFGSMATTRPISRAAASILMDWPDGFHRMLEGLQSRYQGKTTGGNQFVGQFGNFYNVLFEHFCQPEFSAIVFAFEAFIAAHWRRPLSNRNKLLSPDLRQKHIWIPAKEAAKILSASQKQLAQLYEDGEISGHVMVTPGGRKMLCVDRRDIPQMASAVMDIIDLRTTSKLLGIQKKRVIQLIRAGLMGRTTAPDKDRSSHWTISRSIVDAYITLGAALPEQEASSESLGISLNNALRFVLHREHLFPDLIRAVIENGIKLVAVVPGREGIGAWVFDRTELAHWMKERIAAVTHPMFSISGAARRLGLKQQTAYHLAHRQILGVIENFKTKQLMVPEYALEVFREKFILGSEIAVELKTSPKRANKLLAEQGVFAVCGPSVDRSGQYVYRREVALNAIAPLLEMPLAP